MSKEYRRRHRRQLKKLSLGLPPGTLIHRPDFHRPDVTMIAYNEGECVEHSFKSWAEAKRIASQKNVVWINVDGLGDIKFIERFGTEFGIHPLTLEDILNTHQRAKIEDFSNYLYIVLRMASNGTMKLSSEQISIILIDNFVITLQEEPGDCLEPLRERIRTNKGRVRSKRADYLVYSLVDSVIDGYFPMIDHVGERLDNIEDKIISGDESVSIREIHAVRADLLYLQRILRPHRDMINELMRDELPHISVETLTFFRDCFDHLLHLGELTETYRESCSDVRDFQLSKVANRTNDVMKTLTIISTIFIPLSFVAGVYGMNFEFMPELGWPSGYFATLGLMFSVAVGLLGWFWRRGWFKKS